MLKPTKLKDFDDGQAFIQHYDYSTSVEDFGYFCVFLETLLKALNTHTNTYIVDLTSQYSRLPYL